MSFEFLGLSDALMKAIAESGYTEPTPIQRQAIPMILQGRDILGIAQTGTGKTASFTLPMLDILDHGRARARMPRSLILEPTRELAHQVAESFDRYGKHMKLSKALLIGGVAFGDQDRLLEKGVDVLIATPGRLIDQFERSKILMSGVEILVIDEADRMLDMGFIPDVERICSMLPVKRQTLFFSATMPPPVKALADRFLRDPKAIEVARPATAAATIAQKLLHVGEKQKREALRALLKSETVQNAIIFCNRKTGVKTLLESLKRHRMNAAALHGDMDQSERLAVLERFRSGDIQLLVASDVAARGLDIPSVSHVFNFDVPIHADDYVHRIGRTGRAGRSGTSISFATPRDAEAVEAIEKLTKQPIERIALAGVVAPEAGDAPAKRPKRTARKRVAAPPSEKAPAPKVPDQKPEASAKPVSSRMPRAKDADDDAAEGWGGPIPSFLSLPGKKR